MINLLLNGEKSFLKFRPCFHRLCLFFEHVTTWCQKEVKAEQLKTKLTSRLCCNTRKRLQRFVSM